MPVGYVFEDGAGSGSDRFTGEVHEGVRSIFSNDRFRRAYSFDSLAFREKKDCPELQAADFVVWDVRQHHLAEAQGREHLRSASPVLTVRYFDKAVLDESIKGFEEMKAAGKLSLP